MFGVCQLWYQLGKTLAEEAAWKFSRENKIDMVAINPGTVLGPLLQPTRNSYASVDPVISLMKGISAFQLINEDISLLCSFEHIFVHVHDSRNGICLMHRRERS